MQKWCHQPINFRYRSVLQYAALVAIVVALITTYIFTSVVYAAPNTDRTISFQGRLLNSSGAVVADGHYNMQFKIYQGGSGKAADNPDGSLEWTESHVNNSQNSGIRVKNGYFVVNLGSVTPFGSSIDWEDDTLWLSMNIAGRAADCSSFGNGPCTADGEMLPMKQITASAYAINSGAVGGKTADQLVQLGQGVQTDSQSGSSIAINKTGSGDLMQLQSNGRDAFSISNSGDIVLGSSSNKVISVANADTNTAGSSLSILAGNSGDGGGSGGDLILQGGAAGNDPAGSDINGPNVIESENYEHGPHGNTISTSNTIFDNIFSNGGSYEFSNEWSIYGALSAKYTTQASIARFIPETSVSAQRWYMNIPAIPTSNTSIASVALGSGGSSTARVGLYTDGTVRLRNLETANGPATQPLPTNTPIRAEWKVDAINETQEVRFYWGSNLHGTTPNTSTSTSIYTLGPYDRMTVSPTTASEGFVLYVDEWAYGDDWVGPLRLGGGNGGNIVLAGGAGKGPGSKGQVILGASAFSTETSDPNCYIDGVAVADSCTISKASVDDYSAVLVGFSSPGLIAKLPNPSITDAGRVFYVMAANQSNDFTLNINDSDDIPMQQNTTLALMWNGYKWSTLTTTTTPGMQNFQLGDGEPFMLDLGDEANTETDDSPETNSPDPQTDSEEPEPIEPLAGSLYYDDELGKLQCMEADGWGDCGAMPDTFVSISPEYSNAVMNGTDIGTITSDLCSDALNINDGTNDQPAICGTDETYNFYSWTTEEDQAQTRSIFVTYKLPANFKQFIDKSTSIAALTDGDGAKVDYRIYRDNKESGLEPCGPAIAASSGNQPAWAQTTADDQSDPSSCGFTAGDSILFRIDLTATKNTSAYVSDLDFTFSVN